MKKHDTKNNNILIDCAIAFGAGYGGSLLGNLIIGDESQKLEIIPLLKVFTPMAACSSFSLFLLRL